MTDAPRSPQEVSRRGSWPPAAWGAAVVILGALVAALGLLPAYRDRLAPSVNQVRLLPQRLDTPLEQIQYQTKGERYDLVRTARERTFPEAVILVSNDPADGPLASILWLSYYLYPRVLVQTRTLNANPGMKVDYVLVTRNFPPEGYRPGDDAGMGVSVVSERARQHALRQQGER